MRRINKLRRRQMIADAAYFRAEQRGFHAGDATADWLEAEREVDAMLRNREDLLCLLEERLAWANQRLGAFQKRTVYVTGEARSVWEAEIENLERLRDGLKSVVTRIVNQGVCANERALRQAERIWANISEIMERLGPRKVWRFLPLEAGQHRRRSATSEPEHRPDRLAANG